MTDTRDESPDERYDRNMNELLQELRVALPGVQVLFAFLLTVVFTQRFDRVTEFQTHLYVVTLLCSAVASACFIAPTAYHRLNFRQGDKRHIVDTASRFAVLGLVALAIAMTAAVVLVMDLIFGSPTVWITGIAVGAMFVVLWFVLPLLRRASHQGDGEHESGSRARD
jgi:membrane-bound acyltransferase YfiQ involved in biofilm formation